MTEQLLSVILCVFGMANFNTNECFLPVGYICIHLQAMAYQCEWLKYESGLSAEFYLKPNYELYIIRAACCRGHALVIDQLGCICYVESNLHLLSSYQLPVTVFKSDYGN